MERRCLSVGAPGKLNIFMFVRSQRREIYAFESEEARRFALRVMRTS
jgi:hypothetical protein